jgi:hypothetical protein
MFSLEIWIYLGYSAARFDPNKIQLNAHYDFSNAQESQMPYLPETRSLGGEPVSPILLGALQDDRPRRLGQ